MSVALVACRQPLPSDMALKTPWRRPASAPAPFHLPRFLHRRQPDRDASGAIAWESVSIGRRVNCERVVLLGWGTAVLLQFAHPKVAAGVSQHTAAMESPTARVRRLNRTVQAMIGLTFGEQAEAAAVAERINNIHTRVNGVVL